MSVAGTGVRGPASAGSAGARATRRPGSVALVAGWSGEDEGLAPAVEDLVGHLHSVGQTTLHQPGVRNMIDTVLAGGLEGPRNEVVARMTAVRASDAGDG